MAENLGASFSIDVTELKAGLQQANRLIRESESEFKAAAAGMDDWTKSQEGLEKKIKSLNNIADLQSKKVEALEAEYNRLINDGLDPTSAKAVDLRTQINRETEALNKSKSEINKQTAALNSLQASDSATAKQTETLTSKVERQEKELKDLKTQYINVAAEQGETSDEAKTLAKQISTLSGDLKENKTKLDAASKAADGADQSLEEMGDSTKTAAKEAKDASSGGFTVLKGTLANLATEIINGAVKALKSFAGEITNTVKEAAAAGDEIDKMSQKIGISTQAYQEWDYVFERSGADVNALQGGMKKLSKVITDAGNGSESAAKKLEAVGLSVDELNGLTQEEQLSKIVEALQNMDQGAERTAAATALLGNSATDMAAVLNMSAEETNALKKEAEDYGMIMSDEAVKSSVAFTDSMTKLKNTAAGLKNNLAGEFLPSITSIMDHFANILTGKEGFDGVLDDVEKIIEKAVPKIVDIIVKLGDSLAKLVEKAAPRLIKLLNQNLPKIIKTLLSLAGQIGKAILQAAPDLVRSALQIITDVINMLAVELPGIVDTIVEIIPDIVAALTDPEMLKQLFDAAIKLLMAIVDAIPKITETMTEQLPVIIDNILEFLLDPDTLEQLAQAGFKLFSQLAFGIPRMLPQLATALGKIVKSVFTKLSEPVKKVFANLWSGIKTIFSGVGEWFGGKFTAAWNAIKNAFSGFGQWFKDKFAELINIFAGIPSWFKSLFQRAWKNIKGVFSGVGEFFGGIWETIKGKFTDIGQKIGEAVGGAFKKAWNFVIDTVEDVANILPNAINSVTGWINDFFDTDIGQVGTFDFSGAKLAKGGVVNKATAAIIGEDGAEAVMPLEKNTGWIDLLATTLAEKIGGGVVVNQTNNYSQAHSRFEIFKSQQATAKAVKLALAK